MERVPPYRRGRSNRVIKIVSPNTIEQNKSTAVSDSQWSELKDLYKKAEWGFLSVADRTDYADHCRKVADDIKKNFNHVFWIGIGGSSLGPIAIHKFFDESLLKIEFCESPDREDILRKLKNITQLEKVHFVIVSKSGSTIETLSIADFFSQQLKSKGLKLERQATVITETKENPLSDWSRAKGVPLLEIPLNVGGRFSVLTPVGLLLLELMGKSSHLCMQGAKEVMNQPEMVRTMTSAILDSWKQEKWVTQCWHYGESLYFLGLWLQQLWAESLAKKSGPRVSTTMVCRGPQDQHSLLQQVIDGVQDKWILFFNVTPPKDHQFVDGTFLKHPSSMTQIINDEEESLKECFADFKIPFMHYEMTERDEKSVGAYFMFWMMVVASLGHLIKISTFDQPGVELSKQFLRKKLNSRLG